MELNVFVQNGLYFADIIRKFYLSQGKNIGIPIIFFILKIETKVHFSRQMYLLKQKILY